MHNYIPVENHASLFRDAGTSAIINNNDIERNMYLAQRRKIEESKLQNENLHNELNDVKTELKQLQELVKQLLNKE